MPELPEVETVRDGLARHVLGATVTGVEVRRGSSVRRHDGGPEDFEGRLVGRTLSAAVRRGKFLWLVLDDAASGEALMAHLGMSGQLLVRGATAAGDPTVPGAAEPATEPATGPDPGAHPHLRTRLHLAPGPRSEGAAAPTSLDFVDQRTFGHLMVADLVPTQDGAPGGWGSDLAAVPAPAAHIARDLLDPHLDRPALVRALRRRRTDVKRALLDQTLISGIGNIYADEALWRARTHFARQTDRLRPSDVERVLDAADAVMREALAAGGTSFDALYVNVNGASGYFDRSLAVYGQEGHPCPRCGTPVVRTAFMNRSSFTCPRCQRRGPATRAGARQQRQAP